jgi:hypothetical protein
MEISLHITLDVSRELEQLVERFIDAIERQKEEEDDEDSGTN